MLIRRSQMDTFSNAAASRFAEKMIVHLRKCFPSRCEALSDNQIHEMIGFGIQRSSSYGITAERDVCKYIDVMMVFGQDFDQNQAIPWAQQILNDSQKTPSDRVEALMAEAKEH
jgi:hypothetical protein